MGPAREGLYPAGTDFSKKVARERGCRNAETGRLRVRQWRLILLWKANHSPIRQGQHDGVPRLKQQDEGQCDDGAEKEGERP